MLKVGERAPEFTLPDDSGQDRSLTDFLHSGATILYFYPADFMPGGVRQACALRDLQGDTANASLQIVGISPQSPRTHARFRAKYGLPFALLSDQHGEVIKMYGVGGPFGFGVRRVTYLIDGSRRIRSMVVADFRIARHVRFVQKALVLRA